MSRFSFSQLLTAVGFVTMSALTAVATASLALTSSAFAAVKANDNANAKAVTASHGPTLQSSAHDVQVANYARPIYSASDYILLDRVGRYSDNLYYSWPQGYPWTGKLAEGQKSLPQLVGVRTSYCKANPQFQQSAIISPVTKTLTFANERFNCSLNHYAAYTPISYIVKNLVLFDNANKDLDYYRADVQATSYPYRPAKQVLLAINTKTCQLNKVPKGGFVTWFWLEGSKFADMRLVGDSGDCLVSEVWVDNAAAGVADKATASSSSETVSLTHKQGFTKLAIDFSKARWPIFTNAPTPSDK